MNEELDDQALVEYGRELFCSFIESGGLLDHEIGPTELEGLAHYLQQLVLQNDLPCFWRRMEVLTNSLRDTLTMKLGVLMVEEIPTLKGVRMIPVEIWAEVLRALKVMPSILAYGRTIQSCDLRTEFFGAYQDLLLLQNYFGHKSEEEEQ